MSEHTDELEPGDQAMIEVIGRSYAAEPMSRAEREAFDVSLMRRHARARRVCQVGAVLGLMVVVTGGMVVATLGSGGVEEERSVAVVEAPQAPGVVVGATAEPVASIDLSLFVPEEREEEMLYLPGDYQAILAMTGIP